MTRQELCELVDMQGKDIYSFCCNLTWNKESADELYQDTFLKAAERLDQIDVSVNPKNYLIQLAVGIWRNNKKKYAVRQRIVPMQNMEDEDYPMVITSEETGPEDVILTKETVQLVRRETAKLHAKYRIPVYLFYTAQMSIDEIAAAMHIPKGTVKSRLHKARNLIKEGLEASGYER